MKLLHCLSCNDVRALSFDERECACGASRGRYVDRLWVEYAGPARIIGMRSDEVLQSLRDEHISFVGPHYVWFVINDGDHIRRIDSPTAGKQPGAEGDGSGTRPSSSYADEQ